jgi:hypothetical protein
MRRWRRRGGSKCEEGEMRRRKQFILGYSDLMVILRTT